MKWGFTIQNKLKIAVLLLVVFAALLVRNMVEKRHAAELGTSFNSVYKDRLLVEGYIYELSNCLHAKKELISRPSAHDRSASLATEMARYDAKIAELLTAFEQTKLTEQEAVVLTSLKKRLHTLDRTGQSWLNRLAYDYPTDDLQAQMAVLIGKASNDLHQLSTIQLAVGRDMNDQSQKILSKSSVLSQFAVVMLIVLGLVVQVLIFSHEDRIRKVPNIRLN